MTPPSFSANKSNVDLIPISVILHQLFSSWPFWDYGIIWGDFSTLILPKNKTKHNKAQQKKKTKQLLLLPDVKIWQAIGRHSGKLEVHCRRCCLWSMVYGQF